MFLLKQSSRLKYITYHRNSDFNASVRAIHCQLASFGFDNQLLYSIRRAIFLFAANQALDDKFRPHFSTQNDFIVLSDDSLPR